MQSVGPTPDTEAAVQVGPVPAPRDPAAVTPLAVLQRFGGNRAVAALLAGAPQRAAADAAPAPPAAPAAQVATGRRDPVPPLEDPDFNPTNRAHDLVRAIDSSEHTFRMKSSGFMGSEEDVEAERRKIDFPTVVAALDGLTPSQVKKVEQTFHEFDNVSLRECLFGGGETGRLADLTKDQVARLQVLMQGTRPDPLPPALMEELRRYPPELAARFRADLEQRADAEAALRRHEAEAIELHELLAGDLDEARREKVMTMHRRHEEEIDAVDAMYDKHYGKGVLAADLNRRLDGLQRVRMTELRLGNVAQADACAIEDKRRKIEALDKQDEQMSSYGIMGGGVYYDVLKEQRRKQKQELTADIQQIIDLNRQEAIKESAGTGRGAGQAVAERLNKILGQQDGEAGNTLGSELNRTLGKEDAAVITAMSDTWNASGDANIIQAAAAQLAADEKAGTTSAAKIMSQLRSFRKLAERALTDQAFDPATPIEEKQAIARDREGAVTRLAQKYIDDYKAAYDRMAGDKGRSYDKIVASADDADEQLMRNLAYGGGETSDLGELDHAMGSKDVEKVKDILGKQPNREAVEKLETAYNQLGSGRNLRRQLFGVTMKEETATPEQAQSSEAFAAVGGMVRGREAALVGELLGKPKAADLAGPDAGAAAKAQWYAEGGAAEFSATWANRGATGRLREIGDDPETQRLLERTRDDLAMLKKQFDTEKDPAKRARLVEEMRKLRATLTGDATAYEKDNERVLGEIRSALSFAVSIALAVAIPGAGPGIVAFLQTTAINIAANVAANFVIKGGDYGLEDLKADLLGGALGAGGAKFGEELMGRVAAAVLKPAAETTVEAAGRLGLESVLSKEVGTLAGAGEKAVIRAEEFEIRTATREVATEIVAQETTGIVSREFVISGAREVGGFFGGLYGPKVMTGDYGLTIDEVLKAFAATAAGKIAHRNKGGGKAEEEPAGKRPAEEEAAAGKRPAEEEAAAGKRPAEETLPAAGFVPEPVPPANADVLGRRTAHEMLLANGIPPASAEGFQSVADNFNVIIKVRPTNTASLPVLERGGVAKPELIKAKTVNRVDQLIGAPADGLGKVGFFEPVMPSKEILDVMAPEARQAVEQRFAQRAEEHAHYQEEYGKLAAEGLLKMEGGVLKIVDPRTGEFRDIGGDHDIFEIVHTDGKTRLNTHVRRGIINKLRSMGINVEHPDHISWKEDSPGTHDPAADAKIRQQHETSEALVAFLPKSQPREVMAGEALTGPARAEGAGDRFLPAVEGQVVEPTGEPGPSGRTDETDFSVPPRHATPEEIAATREPAPFDTSPMRPRGREVLDRPEVSEAAYRMARDMYSRTTSPEWAGSTPQRQLEILLEAAHQEVTATGVPKPRIAPIGGENSSFDPKNWLINIGPALMRPQASVGELAMLCDHIRHELEHAIIDFRRIRREARLRGEDGRTLARRLGVDPDVAEWAAKGIHDSPAAAQFETVAAGTPEDAQAKALSDSLADPKRKQILDRIIASETALEKARETHDAAGTKESAEALAKAEAENREAFRDYAALPDEKLAWSAGAELQVAVRRVASLHQQIRRAVARLDRHELARNAVPDGDPRISGLDRNVKEAAEALGKLIDQLDQWTGR